MSNLHYQAMQGSTVLCWGKLCVHTKDVQLHHNGGLTQVGIQYHSLAEAKWAVPWLPL